MSDPVKIEISREMVTQIIESKIQQSIVEGLKGQEHLVQAAVERILTQKVDSEGKVSNYSHSTSPTYLQWLCDTSLKAAVKEAIARVFEARKEEMSKAVEKALKVKAPQVADALVNCVLDSAKSNYRGLMVNVTFNNAK